jgi:hypothetical protein
VSLLTVAQNVAEEVGFAAPSYVIGNPDRTAKQLLRLITRGGDAMAKKPWPRLQKEYTFTTVPGQAEYDYPAGCSEFISNTLWDRTNYWQVRGGLTPQEWQQRKSAITVSASTRKAFRIKISFNLMKIFLDPTPTAAEDMVIEYISSLWIVDDAHLVFRSRFVSDTDDGIFPEPLHEADGIWRFRAAKGMDYSEAKHDFDLLLESVFGAEAALGSINMGSRPTDQLWRANIRESGFG